MRYLSILIILLQFMPIEASWRNKTINDLNTAISWNNTYAIRMIIKHHPEYLNHTDSLSRNVPLIRAVEYRHFRAAQQLLELGANPNIRSLTGFTPLMAAILEHPRQDYIHKDTKYIRLLAKYGVNIDDTCRHIPCELLARGSEGILTNMLMLTMPHHINKLKCLVELGADIEQVPNHDGVTVATYALLLDIEKAHYLIVEKHADVTHLFYKYKYTPHYSIGLDSTTKHNPIEYLLDMVYPLDSKEYILKMEIVEEFKRQGVDYHSWKDRIPKKTIERIKYLYGDDWESYIEKY